MNDHPAPSSSSSLPEHGYRQQLNNWLQSRGWRDRLKSNASEVMSENRPMWFSTYEIDGVVYGMGKGRKRGDAEEMAARIAYRRLLWEAVELLIQRRSNNAAS